MIVEDKLMHYVLYKKRTENEVRRKCMQMHYSEEQTEEVIDYLKEAEYIQDDVYVEKYVKQLQKLKHVSANEIRMDLLRRGIASEKIDEVLDTEEIQAFELESAKYIVEKKRKAGEEEEKIKKFLHNKGYSYENIAKAIDN